MKQLRITKDLKNFFKSTPDTLIFEGYCSNAYGVTVLNEGDNYALVVDLGDRKDVCFKTRNAAFVYKMIKKLDGVIKVCGVDPFITKIFKSRYKFNWETHCDLYVWNGKKIRHRPEYAVYPMEIDFAQRVCDTTPYHPSFDEVADCILNRPSAAIYVDDVPVCWCLQHVEKSIGMLYTEAAYRHQGYALEVMVGLCNEIISMGDIPFAYIVQGNAASENLAGRYNMVKVKQADYFEVDLDEDEDDDDEYYDDEEDEDNDEE